MVLSPPVAAVLVPDEATWTMAGCDPAAMGLAPSASGAAARVLLAPGRVPDALAPALLAELRRAARPPAVRTADAVSLGGRPLADVLAEGLRAPAGPDDHAVHQGHGAHDEHGHDGHGDMMAIVGEPSSDGLVMEATDFRFGPLTAVLPGGLVLDLTLDGDVVAACAVHATLRAAVDGPPAGADPLAPVAWTVVDVVAREAAQGATPAATAQWQRVAAVELERALSHLTWLRSLGRVLGWAHLTRAAQRAITALARLHADPPQGPDAGAVRAVAGVLEPVKRLLAGRRFAYRTRGRARTADGALVGPNARAAGLAGDARAGDPLYRGLGFSSVGETGGDALARTAVRMREAEQSLELAAAALERAADDHGPGVPGAFTTPAGARVEGPRGPLLGAWLAREERTVRAVRGATPALGLAGDSVVGLEWSAALVALVSFDLSPWRVGP